MKFEVPKDGVAMDATPTSVFGTVAFWAPLVQHNFFSVVY
jgi:hypothetical protein